MTDASDHPCVWVVNYANGSPPTEYIRADLVPDVAAKDAEIARLRLIVDTIVPESGGFDPDKETGVQALALEWCKRFHGMREEVATLKEEHDDMHDTSRNKDAEIARLRDALENINRRASLGSDDRTFDDCSRDLYWCACEARRVLFPDGHYP